MWYFLVSIPDYSLLSFLIIINSTVFKNNKLQYYNCILNKVANNNKAELSKGRTVVSESRVDSGYKREWLIQLQVERAICLLIRDNY